MTCQIDRCAKILLIDSHVTTISPHRFDALLQLLHTLAVTRCPRVFCAITNWYRPTSNLPFYFLFASQNPFLFPHAPNITQLNYLHLIGLISFSSSDCIHICTDDLCACVCVCVCVCVLQPNRTDPGRFQSLKTWLRKTPLTTRSSMRGRGK